MWPILRIDSPLDSGTAWSVASLLAAVSGGMRWWEIGRHHWRTSWHTFALIILRIADPCHRSQCDDIAEALEI